MDSIVGTWRLLSLRVKNETGGVTFPFGNELKGLLIYEKDGYMAGMISGENRPNVSSPALAGISDNERASIAKNFISYAGKYRIEENRIAHDIEVSFIPNLMSVNSHTQNYELKGDILKIMSETMTKEGNKIEVIVVWMAR